MTPEQILAKVIRAVVEGTPVLDAAHRADIYAARMIDSLKLAGWSLVRTEERDELVAKILEQCPPSWEEYGDEPSVALEYVRTMEARMDRHQISREYQPSTECHPGDHEPGCNCPVVRS